MIFVLLSHHPARAELEVVSSRNLPVSRWQYKRKRNELSGNNINNSDKKREAHSPERKLIASFVLEVFPS